MKSRRFRVAFSFAGEKRSYVEKVAVILADRFGQESILYDKFHEAEFARFDLGILLPELYEKESDLIVPVLCPAYDEKNWTGWEWVHIHGLLTKTDGHRVMPTRFGRENHGGLSLSAGFIELDEKTPEQFADIIFERLALNEGHAKNHYTELTESGGKNRHARIPNNLPRLQSFFGRQEELVRIGQAMNNTNSSWGVIISGPGGIGKTSLAVQAALECGPNQFDRIIFVSVKNRELDDEGIRELGPFVLSNFTEMLNELARQLEQLEITKSPPNERPRLLLTALRSVDALIILDNLESLTKANRDQVLTFVERLPRGCKALLTSRHRIGSSSEELVLDRLSRSAALEVIADIAKHNKLLDKTTESECVSLYNQIAGRPLLLRWVAGQVGRGSCRTATDALEFLRTCPSDNDPYEFIFGDVMEHLSDIEIRALCALTHFRLAADVRYIADITGNDAKSVRLILLGVCRTFGPWFDFDCGHVEVTACAATGVWDGDRARCRREIEGLNLYISMEQAHRNRPLTLWLVALRRLTEIRPS